MPILCEPAATARHLIASIGGEVRTAETLQVTAQMLDYDPAETLVIIGPDVPLSDALNFAANLRLTRPRTGVVLTRKHVDIPLLTLALRAGIREVVPADDADALAAACRRSYEVSQGLTGKVADLAPQPARNGELITVFAAKGGCGKTTFAINLACALASDPGLRVCVVDLDLSFGDVGISVRIDPVRTITDAVPMAGHLDDTGAASLLTGYRDNLAVLLAPVTPGDAENIPQGTGNVDREASAQVAQHLLKVDRVALLGGHRPPEEADHDSRGDAEDLRPGDRAQIPVGRARALRYLGHHEDRRRPRMGGLTGLDQPGDRRLGEPVGRDDQDPLR